MSSLGMGGIEEKARGHRQPQLGRHCTEPGGCSQATAEQVQEPSELPTVALSDTGV